MNPSSPPSPGSSPEPSPTRSQRVDEDSAGQRLDLWIVAHDPSLTRSRIQSLIAQGHVTVDGQVRPARTKVKSGSEVVWTTPPPEPVDMTPDPSVEFELVHEDAWLVVVNKPPGLVVHPGPGHRSGTLVHGLLARLDMLSGVGGRARPGLVHRLDRWTSGLLVVAKNDDAHLGLQAQLADRSLTRVYDALVWGTPREGTGSIEAPLDRHPTDRQRRSVQEGGREAKTSYRVTEQFEGASRVELKLHTGRTHQIRVHLLHLGHPVLGDPEYGGDARRLKGAAPDHRSRLKRALGQLNRQALHAGRLGFVHPGTGEPMEFTAALPPDHLRALEFLRGS